LTSVLNFVIGGIFDIGVAANNVGTAILRVAAFVIEKLNEFVVKGIASMVRKLDEFGKAIAQVAAVVPGLSALAPALANLGAVADVLETAGDGFEEFANGVVADSEKITETMEETRDGILADLQAIAEALNNFFGQDPDEIRSLEEMQRQSRVFVRTV